MIAEQDSDRRDMVLSHLPLAQRLARRYANSPQALEELTQVAYLGLVKAADRFDPEHGVTFASFAIPTILGELKRHFRTAGWAAHMPRRLQERALRVDREVSALTGVLGRAPTAAEVAEAAELPVEEVLEALEARSSAGARSLDASRPDDEEENACLLDRLGSDDPSYEHVEDTQALAPALRALDPRQQLVLRLTFFDGLTQREIGERLGISQMQVCRILRRTLEGVRAAVRGAEAA